MFSYHFVGTLLVVNLEINITGSIAATGMDSEIAFLPCSWIETFGFILYSIRESKTFLRISGLG